MAATASDNAENYTKDVTETVQVKTSKILHCSNDRVSSIKRQNPLLHQRTGFVSLG